MRGRLLWLPLALFVALLGVAAVGLIAPSGSTIASQMVGQPLPSFALAASQPGKPGVASADFARGRPHLLNMFASWCVPCMAEAPQLLRLAQAGVPIAAVAVRDRPEDTAAFLARYGDPYVAIGQDPASQVQLALGSSGVPETFLVDGRGIIRRQYIGDVRAEQVSAIIADVAAAR